MKFNEIIYFDNAATTRKKPEIVHNAFESYIREIGTSPGRGSHLLAIEASRCLYQSRKVVSNYFGCPSTNVIFTKNATEASNLFLRGFLEKDDHVLISPMEHNAIFRPLHKLKEEGRIEYGILPMEAFRSLDKDDLDLYIRENTKLCILSLASNITGEILYSSKLIKYLKSRDIKVLLDTAQGAGRVNLNMIDDNIDFLIFTGHKDLYGLPGTGGLCSLKELDIEPLIQGGTGVHSETFTNPNIIPEKYEAGTLNMPSIWSLKSGIKYVEENKEEILDKERNLYSTCLEELKTLPRIIVYGNNDLEKNLSIISFNVDGMDCQEVSYYLSENNICVRSGHHCNILGHTYLGTENTGVVRASLDYYNSLEEVEKFIYVIKKMIKE
ncbi:aminotransferase class V-fold PLP-dependent enzyme [Anaerosalibacter sp. Marseille-P3206]|uniref:aminotransferase class V-fold PLP-dependent enzyme n=1 Tax=Anaerosalibacter sp. Marseille-P3206 TaxID=1871005 RepID=UPI000986EE32|nr:aminotransferase class V-fold PLP-dependent enzyme [Anaerosalibacter sp. Marseille-P3206]